MAGRIENLIPFKPGEPQQIKARALHRHVREMVGNDPKVVLAVLLGVAQDPRARDADRISAARELLDRGWGKAVSLVLVDESGGASKLDETIRELLDEIRGGNGGTSTPPDIEAPPRREGIEA